MRTFQRFKVPIRFKDQVSPDGQRPFVPHSRFFGQVVTAEIPAISNDQLRAGQTRLAVLIELRFGTPS